MANFIEKTEIDTATYVPGSSRYVDSIIYKYGENYLLTFETYKRSPQKVSAGDRYWVITKGYEYRPDLLSYEIYGVVDFWWRILEANNMMDIMDFEAGRNIRLPENVY